MKCPKCLTDMWLDILEGNQQKNIDDVEIGICYGCASMYRIEGYVDPGETDPDEISLVIEEIYFYDIYSREFDENTPSAEDLTKRVEQAIEKRKKD